MATNMDGGAGYFDNDNEDRHIPVISDEKNVIEHAVEKIANNGKPIDGQLALELKRKKNAERIRHLRANMTPEQREVQRKKNAERVRLKRKSMSEQERASERERDAQRRRERDAQKRRDREAQKKREDETGIIPIEVKDSKVIEAPETVEPPKHNLFQMIDDVCAAQYSI